MQSGNYRDLRETYGSHSLTWKIRKALVEGLSGCYGKGRGTRDTYYQLILKFSANNEQRLGQLKSFFDNPQSQSANPKFLDDVLRDFHPKYGHWLKEAFSETDKKKLIDDGVIIESSSTDAKGLLKDLTGTERRQVIIADTPLVDPNIEYKKLTPQQILLLNGAKVIREFAQGKFDVPTPFTGITNELYLNLQRYHFSFPEALSTAFDVLSDELAFAVRRPDGNKTYIFLWDLFEGDELYCETKAFRPELLDTSVPDLMRQGKIQWHEFKYQGQNQFRVPRRNPTSRKPYDYVTTRYLPNLVRPRDMWLEWFNTEMVCDCDYALNYRNKEERTGLKMVRYTQIVDPHPRWVIRLVADNLGQTEQITESMIYPTAFAISSMDAIRNRLHNKQGNTKSNMNKLLRTTAKIYGPEKMLQSEPPKKYEVLKPLYTGIQRIR